MAAKIQKSDVSIKLMPVGVEGFRVIAALYAQAFDEPWPEPSVRELMAIPGTWGLVATLEEEPIGFLLMRIVVDEGEVLALGVPPAYRRNGVAKKLLIAGVDRARSSGAASVFLEVGADNPAAIKLYESHEFQQFGRRKNYYRRANGDRVDALVMRYDYTPN